MTPPPKTKPKRKAKSKRKRSAPVEVLGWREWIGLPDFGVDAIKVKLDTGARTSALHAVRLRPFVRDGVDMVRFEVHPIQRSAAPSIPVEAEVIEHRVVRNSGGREEERPVIRTTIQVGQTRWPIELTLTSRAQMGFRMLLGRQALRKRFVVDPGSSYRSGRRPSGGRSGSSSKRKKD